MHYFSHSVIWICAILILPSSVVQADDRRCFYSSKERPHDIAVCNEIIKRDKNKGGLNLRRAYQTRGEQYYRSGQFDLAIKDFSAAIKLRSSSYNLWHRGLAYFKSGQYSPALKDLDSVIRRDPEYSLIEDVAVLRMKAALALREAGKPVPPRPRQAKKIKNVLFFDPINEPKVLKEKIGQCTSNKYLLPRRKFYHSLYFQGLSATKGLVVCTEVIKSKLSTDSEKAAAYLNRARMFRHRNEFNSLYFVDNINKAIEDLNTAIQLQPKLARAYYYRAAFVRLLPAVKPENNPSGKSREDEIRNIYDGAIKDLSTAIQIDPQYASPYVSRGIIFSGRKQYKRALEDFDAAIRISPDNANSYIKRGNLYLEMTKYDLAIRDFDTVLKMGNKARGFRSDAEAGKKRAKFAALPAEEKERIHRESQKRSAENRKREQQKRCKTLLSGELDKKSNSQKNLEKTKTSRIQQRLAQQRARMKEREIEKCKSLDKKPIEVARLKPQNTDKNSNRIRPVQKKPKTEHIQGLKGCDSRTPHIAIRACTEKINSGKATAFVYHARGKAFLRNNEPEKAIADLEKGLQARKTDKSFVFASQNLRARAFMQLRQYPNALSAFDEAIKARPDIAQTYSERGQTYFKTDQYDLAIKDYSKALSFKNKTPLKISLYYHRARSYSRKKQFDNALKDYAEALKLGPKVATLYYGRGEVYLVALRQYKKALEDFDKAVELSPKYANALHLRGKTYQKLGQGKEALTDFSAAIVQRPNFFLARRDRALLLKAMKQDDVAIKEFDTLVGNWPKYYDGFKQRGLLYIRKKQFSKAIADFSVAIEARPNDLTLHYHRSYAFASVGKLDQALKDVNFALRGAPNHKDLKRLKAHILKLNGARDKNR